MKMKWYWLNFSFFFNHKKNSENFSFFLIIKKISENLGPPPGLKATTPLTIQLIKSCGNGIRLTIPI